MNESDLEHPDTSLSESNESQENNGSELPAEVSALFQKLEETSEKVEKDLVIGELRWLFAIYSLPLKILSEKTGLNPYFLNICKEKRGPIFTPEDQNALDTLLTQTLKSIPRIAPGTTRRFDTPIRKAVVAAFRLMRKRSTESENVVIRETYDLKSGLTGEWESDYRLLSIPELIPDLYPKGSEHHSPNNDTDGPPREEIFAIAEALEAKVLEVTGERDAARQESTRLQEELHRTKEELRSKPSSNGEADHPLTQSFELPPVPQRKIYHLFVHGPVKDDEKQE